MPASHPGTCSHRTAAPGFTATASSPLLQLLQLRSLTAIDTLVLFGGPVRGPPLTTPSEKGRRGTGCRGGCHRLYLLCGGGMRLFETSSAAFLICKIGTGIPYLAEVPRRLISICRALRKTKHQAKQSTAAWQGRLLQGAQPGQHRGSRSASHSGDRSAEGRRPRGCNCAGGQTDRHAIRRAKNHGERKLCVPGTFQGTPAQPRAPAPNSQQFCSPAA